MNYTSRKRRGICAEKRGADLYEPRKAPDRHRRQGQLRERSNSGSEPQLAYLGEPTFRRRF